MSHSPDTSTDAYDSPWAREYELTVRQQPKQARMCGVSGKDRRPIDPPPIVELRVRERRKEDYTGPSDDGRDSVSFLENPYYFMFASLASVDSDTEMHLLSDGHTRCTTGQVVSSLYHLKDTENRNSDAGFFVFPDLSVRTEGSYRLKLSLFEIVGMEVQHCKSIFSKPFYVYTAKKFPGMEESTPLSCSLADQGIKIRIRKDIRVRKRPQGQRDRYDDDDDDDGGGGTPTEQLSPTAARKIAGRTAPKRPKAEESPRLRRNASEETITPITSGSGGAPQAYAVTYDSQGAQPQQAWGAPPPIPAQGYDPRAQYPPASASASPAYGRFQQQQPTAQDGYYPPPAGNPQVRYPLATRHETGQGQYGPYAPGTAEYAGTRSPGSAQQSYTDSRYVLHPTPGQGYYPPGSVQQPQPQQQQQQQQQQQFGNGTGTNSNTNGSAPARQAQYAAQQPPLSRTGSYGSQLSQASQQQQQQQQQQSYALPASQGSSRSVSYAPGQYPSGLQSPSSFSQPSIPQQQQQQQQQQPPSQGQEYYPTSAPQRPTIQTHFSSGSYDQLAGSFPRSYAPAPGSAQSSAYYSASHSPTSGYPAPASAGTERAPHSPSTDRRETPAGGAYYTGPGLPSQTGAQQSLPNNPGASLVLAPSGDQGRLPPIGSSQERMMQPGAGPGMAMPGGVGVQSALVGGGMGRGYAGHAGH
ncbi:hypothetical protein CALVIDRAFT_340763 [Calocera viscosa TUFC12733]|uniref:Velvet domain-containing protein n=1 Tax=Calocera viscosa (strain TUFC12733) TaxID=1330018 RepID=A0A167HHX8_CALVF|nr:hypothetical protein CALVIDRAFT_340763 [Calocera viscosa TUFC12733]